MGRERKLLRQEVNFDNLTWLAPWVVALATFIGKHGYDRAKAETLREHLSVVETKHEDLRREHEAFKLTVAQNYTTAEVVHHMEARLLTAIGGWGSQIERLADRIDRLFHTTSKE